MMKKIGIIGGGASGIMAALNAKTENTEVTLFERKDRIGKKILVTGNGRCNFTNERMSEDYFYCDDDDFVSSVLNTFGNKELISFFSGLGLLIHERNGYYYPYSDQASGVLDCLRYALNEKNINIVTDCLIEKIENVNDIFYAYDSEGKEYKFDKIILACGGKAGLSKKENANGYDLIKAFGLKISKLYPALTQIKCDGLNFKALSGVKSEAHIYLFEDEDLLMEQYGELLFNESGISGIVSFQLSHCVSKVLEKRKRVTLVCDLLPGIDENDLANFVRIKSLLNENLTLEEFFTGIHNKKLNVEIIKQCGLKPSMKASELSVEELTEAVLLLKNVVLLAIGVNDFESAQVTAGGISTDLLNKSMEVKSIEGLYITGELIDVDGLCGGYNLQWAFSTGFIAGKSAAES